jgi:hypothetical protein
LWCKAVSPPCLPAALFAPGLRLWPEGLGDPVYPTPTSELGPGHTSVSNQVITEGVMTQMPSCSPTHGLEASRLLLLLVLGSHHLPGVRLHIRGAFGGGESRQGSARPQLKGKNREAASLQVQSGRGCPIFLSCWIPRLFCQQVVPGLGKAQGLSLWKTGRTRTRAPQGQGKIDLCWEKWNLKSRGLGTTSLLLMLP